MDGLEWAFLSTGYVLTGATAYVLLVPHRYRVRLKKHEEMRCTRYCKCNDWVDIGYGQTRVWRHKKGNEKPELRPGLARHEAIESSLWLAGIWPVTVTLLLVTLTAVGIAWLATALGKLTWLGLLRPVHRLATVRVDRAQEIAAEERSRSQEKVVTVVPRLPALKAGGVVDAADLDD